MRENYKAWEVNYKDFYDQTSREDRLRFLVRFAILAPSSHNSQPWRFRVSENEILLMPEQSRLLPVSDREQKLMLFALGCALENLLTAADLYGFSTEVEYFPIGFNGAVAKVSFTEPRREKDIDVSHLAFAIPARRTNRSKYSDKMPDKEFLEWVSRIPLDDIHIDLFYGKSKEKLSDVIIDFRQDAFEDKPFRKELADYKRTNTTRSPTGMPGFTMGFGTPFSFIAPTLIRAMNIMKLIRKDEEELLKNHTPIIAVISSDGESKESIIRAGRVFERIVLEAKRQGIETAVSAPPKKEAIQRFLETGRSPRVIFRMGYTENIPGHSPRLSAEEVIL